MSTLVVTGAAGYLGSALVRQLTEQLPGVRIRAQIRQTPLSPAALQHANMHVLQGELTDPDFCEALCNGADQVIHLAGYAHTVGSRNTQLALNLNMTNTLVKAAVAMGVRDFTYISSIKAAAPEQSAYAEVKYRQEAMLLDYHARKALEVTCLRPALVYGPGMKGNLRTLLALLSRPVLPVFPIPGATIGLIGLEDCCRAIIASLDCAALRGGCWQLDEGRAYPLQEMVNEVRRYHGYAPAWLPLPRWCVAAGIGLLQALAPLTGKAIGRGSYHSLYNERYSADPAFSAHTGWTPQQQFYDELPHLIKSLRH